MSGATSTGKGVGLFWNAPGLARVWRRVRPVVESVAPFALMIGIWQLVAASDVFPDALFPSVGEIADTIWDRARSGRLFEDVGATLYRMLFGFTVAIIVGTLIGFVMGRVLLFERMLAPMFTVLMPIPALAWVPLFILWFGIGERATIILVAYTSVLYISFNTWAGVRAMNPVWALAARSMNIRGLTLLRKVLLPGALPGIFVGLRLGIAQAWRAVIAGELIAGTTTGLGFVIFNSSNYLDTATMIGTLVVISVLGLIISRYTFTILERRTVQRWGMLDDKRSAGANTMAE